MLFHTHIKLKYFPETGEVKSEPDDKHGNHIVASASINDLAEMRALLEKYKEERDQSISENSELKKKLEESLSNNTKLQAKLNQTTLDKEKLKSKIVQQNVRLEKHASMYVAASNRLRADLARCREDRNRLETEVTQLDRERRHTKRDLDRCREHRRSLELDADKHRRDMTWLLQDIKHTKSERDTYKAKLINAFFRDDLDTVMMVLKEGIFRLDELKAELAAYRKEKAGFHMELNEKASWDLSDTKYYLRKELEKFEEMNRIQQKHWRTQMHFFKQHLEVLKRSQADRAGLESMTLGESGKDIFSLRFKLLKSKMKQKRLQETLSKYRQKLKAIKENDDESVWEKKNAERVAESLKLRMDVMMEQALNHNCSKNEGDTGNTNKGEENKGK